MYIIFELLAKAASVLLRMMRRKLFGLALICRTTKQVFPWGEGIAVNAGKRWSW